MAISRLTEEEQRIISNGWQCPECYGVQIECFKDRFNLKPDRFECQECGCTWHRGAHAQ